MCPRPNPEFHTQWRDGGEIGINSAENEIVQVIINTIKDESIHSDACSKRVS